MTGHFQIIKVQPHAVVINIEKVPNTVLILRITAAPSVREHRRKMAQLPSLHDSETHNPQHQQKKMMSVSGKKALMAKLQHTVDCIVERTGHGRKRLYIVRWYVHVLKHDTLDAVWNILQHSPSNKTDTRTEHRQELKVMLEQKTSGTLKQDIPKNKKHSQGRQNRVDQVSDKQ